MQLKENKRDIIFFSMVIILSIICIYFIYSVVHGRELTITQMFNNPNFEFKDENYFKEQIDSDVFVVDKYLQHNKYIAVVRVLNVADYEINVEIEEDIYNQIEKGSTVHLYREAYYTNQGNNVRSTDIIIV